MVRRGVYARVGGVRACSPLGRRSGRHWKRPTGEAGRPLSPLCPVASGELGSSSRPSSSVTFPAAPALRAATPVCAPNPRGHRTPLDSLSELFVDHVVQWPASQLMPNTRPSGWRPRRLVPCLRRSPATSFPRSLPARCATSRPTPTPSSAGFRQARSTSLEHAVVSVGQCEQMRTWLWPGRGGQDSPALAQDHDRGDGCSAVATWCDLGPPGSGRGSSRVSIGRYGSGCPSPKQRVTFTCAHSAPTCCLW